MFFFRRRHGSHLCKLLALLLGFRFLHRRCHGESRCEHSEEEREAMRAKARTFRSKLREAFDVWSEKPAEQPKAEPTVTE